MMICRNFTDSVLTDFTASMIESCNMCKKTPKYITLTLIKFFAPLRVKNECTRPRTLRRSPLIPTSTRFVSTYRALKNKPKHEKFTATTLLRN